MSSVDQAQYSAMNEYDCDWDYSGSDGWSYDPAQQASPMTDAAAQKAPWDNTPSYGPQDWMDQPAGGAWSFMSLGRKKAPAVRTMTPMNLGAPPGLDLMSVQAAKKSVTTVNHCFRVSSEGECTCCKPADEQ